MTTRTSVADKNRINGMFDAVQERMSYLYWRWQDEKEYEDFADYAAEMKKLLPADFTFIKGTKRPFGFTFSIGTDAVYFINVKNRSYLWGRTK